MITILIVDDEKLERRGIRFLLKREEGECTGSIRIKPCGYFIFGCKDAL